MNLCQPYYIDKRAGAAHVSLDGEWNFCWTDTAVDAPSALSFEYPTEIPASVYHSLHRAGVLPNPYVGTNSKQYHWVDEKVWYYRKTFALDRADFDGNAYLCFDGVAYYSRVWLNKELLGTHEGMFGGPCVDVADRLCFDGENELIVEVKAPNFGKKQGYDFWNEKGQNREIVPWNIVRDTSTGNGDFIVLGLWNHVRVELVEKRHISRPYLHTVSADERVANLHLELELADGTLNELRPFYGKDSKCYEYTRAYDLGLTGAVREDAVDIEIAICDGDACVYRHRERVNLPDWDKSGIDARYLELPFYQADIALDNPKRWYPNGLGDPFLYDVTITMSVGDTVLDSHAFSYGVRTFAADYTKGNKYRNRWDRYLFSINGTATFLKGMNWTPIDYLYDLSPDRYEWCLTLVKNAGIQLIRVWNGGGMPESDTFYDLCDKLGLMVWQDLFIANTTTTEKYPQDVLEDQIAYNLYRIRNHPSLVILCGGNESNPYGPGNAASFYVTRRTVETLAPDRVYYDTTADKGSAHIYNDMEPTCYRQYYKQLPFVGETGIHSFPSYKTLCRFIGEREATAPLPDLASPAFAERFPELLNHFSEYLPTRVPRMMARISQIIDLSGDVTLQDVCEASQMQAYEYYQLMIQAMQENFPVCGGIMPWVFKRPWPTAGIQTVDGDDRPSFAYYAVQNAYRPISIAWCQEWTVLAPGEDLPLAVKVFNRNGEDLSDTEITLTVYNPDLSVYRRYGGNYAPARDFGRLSLDDSFVDTCFLVCADLSRDGVSIARSVYFNKCTSQLIDPALYEQHRTTIAPNLYFDRGPWLKPTVSAARQADLQAQVVGRGTNGRYAFADVRITNRAGAPAYPVTFDVTDGEQRCMLSENFLLLAPNETKTVRVTVDEGDVGEIAVSCWNGNTVYA